jgi:hypothetical protein
MVVDHADLLLESLPDGVVASLQVRDTWRRRASESSGGLEFLVSDLLRWVPGSTVRVAFLDGSDPLHADVAAATEQITDVSGLTLDFGVDDAGRHRRWRETDTQYSAEIRVSFDLDGYWSLIGTDSTDPMVGFPPDDAGGPPHQRSLNLGGFKTDRPPDWRGTVRHEFLHALGFQHAHQNLRGPCENEFRWDDDPGYVPTQDQRGVFVPDGADRRPGIYTYLAGEPNKWPRAKVDHNLRVVFDPGTVVGPFDRESVMLYRFDDFFYKSTPSRCTPTTDGIDLSDGDRRALQLLYPQTVGDLEAIAGRAGTALAELSGGLEAAVATSPYEARAQELLATMAREAAP